MLKYHSKIILLLILLSFISEISSDCRKTFTRYCDNLNDYLNYESDTWTQLIIGNVTHQPSNKWSLFNVWRFLTQDLTELESLTIINQLHGDLNDEIRIDISHKKLKYFNFYQNNLKNFYVYMFSDFPSLIELNLVNNNIKQITTRSSLSSIDTVDLSENQLTEIKADSFKYMKIRVFIIKSNQLSNIETNVFNGTLEILNLDYNEFTYIPDDGLENLENLKELTMSHNKISFISNLSYLKNIEKFDFSYNKINNVRTNFQRFSNLKHIDLSHNLIKKINFVSLIPNNEFPKKVSIAFNYLTQFELSQNEWNNFNFTSPVTLTLFGNPWICKCLEEMQVFLEDRPFKRTKCDLSLFGSGKFPSCVQQKLCVTSGIALQTSFYENFLNVLNESNKHFTCNVDMDMLNIEWNNREYGIVALPVGFRPVGNKTIAYF